MPQKGHKHKEFRQKPPPLPRPPFQGTPDPSMFFKCLGCALGSQPLPDSFCGTVSASLTVCRLPDHFFLAFR